MPVVDAQAEEMARELMESLREGCECTIPYIDAQGAIRQYCPPGCEGRREYATAVRWADGVLSSIPTVGWAWGIAKRVYGWASVGEREQQQRNAAARALQGTMLAMFKARQVLAEQAMREAGAWSALENAVANYNRGGSSAWADSARASGFDGAEVRKTLTSWWVRAVKRAAERAGAQLRPHLPGDLDSLCRRAGAAYSTVRGDGQEATCQETVGREWLYLGLVAGSAVAPGLAENALEFWWPWVARTGLVSADVVARLEAEAAWKPAADARRGSDVVQVAARNQVEFARDAAERSGILAPSRSQRGAVLRILRNLPDILLAVGQLLEGTPSVGMGQAQAVALRLAHEAGPNGVEHEGLWTRYGAPAVAGMYRAVREGEHSSLQSQSSTSGGGGLLLVALLAYAATRRK